MIAAEAAYESFREQVNVLHMQPWHALTTQAQAVWIKVAEAVIDAAVESGEYTETEDP